MNSSPLEERASKLGSSPSAPSISYGGSGTASSPFRAPRGVSCELSSSGRGHRSNASALVQASTGRAAHGRPAGVRVALYLGLRVVKVVHDLHLSARCR